ncbi:MAG: S8 family serine peptidase [Clostridia bacterium]|nr:S8 family serine peptidase [Clostridia bacterium]
MKKGVFSSILAAVLIAAVFVLPIINSKFNSKNKDGDKIDKATSVITESKHPENSKTQTPIVNNDKVVTFIVTVKGNSLLDTVISSNGKYKNTVELLMSDDSKAYCDAIKKTQAVVKASIQKIIPESDFSGCYTYTAVMNGFTVKAPYGSMEKIRKINDVADVAVACSQYYNAALDTTDMYEDTKNMLNLSYAYKSGYSGEKTLISVIDDSFDCMNGAFSAVPSQVKYTQDILNNIFSAVTFNTENFTMPDLYKNDKIIFAYDYADHDNDTYCSGKNHGTGVAGTAAGNNGKDDENAFLGTAYNAQLALMKVCSDSTDSFTDDSIIAALDDSVKIGADVINCSFVSDGELKNTQLFDGIYQKISQTGIYIAAASGNSSYNKNLAQNGNMNSSVVDYGTTGCPSVFESVLSVGGFNSEKYASKYFLADEKTVRYSDIKVIGANGGLIKDTKFFADTLTAKTEYVYLNADGETKDYENIDVRGKIVIINSGKGILSEKCRVAYINGAVALVIIGSDEKEYFRYMDEKYIPAVFVENSYKSYFSENPEGKIIPKSDYKLFSDKQGGKVSDFSSYGVTSDLRLKPEILAPSTNIYSPSDDNSYSIYSGTSMSVSFVSGAAAIIRQYIQDNPSLSTMTSVEQNKYISSLLMSTADVIEYSDGLYYTPRVQGSGMMNIQKALSSQCYLTVRNYDKPKAELKDNKDGSYIFEFTVHNNSEKNVKYNLSYAIQTDKPYVNDDSEIYNSLVPTSLYDYADVTMTVNDKNTKSVTVKAGETADITVNIQLKPEAVLAYNKYFKNGFFVDGYVFLKSSDKNITSLNIPFIAFCGEWTECGVFDTTVYDGKDSVTGAENSLVAVSLNGNTAYTLGKNIFTDEINADNISVGTGTIKYFTENQTAGKTVILPDFQLLRNAYDLTVTISDSNKKVLFTKNFGDFAACSSKCEKPYQLLLKNPDINVFADFVSSLAEGEYNYTVSASVLDSNGKKIQSNSVSYKFIIDNTSPKVNSSRTYKQNDRIYLELSAKDNNAVQGFKFYTAKYNSEKKNYLYADSIDSLIKQNYLSADSYTLTETKTADDGSTIFIYDITNLNSELKRLGAVSAEENTATSDLKIIYRAVDYAFNCSPPKTADTVIYGSAEFTFTDQNGNGVENVVVSMNGTEKSSTADGKIVFDKLVSDIYTAQIISVPQNYEIDDKYFLICVSYDETDIKNNINAKYTGSPSEYPSKSESSAVHSSEQEISAQSNVSEHSKADENQKPPKDRHENDSGLNSIYALLFIGVLLAISIAALVISKQRTKR